jgi:glucan endo-1,3-alpha-glucosidase
MIKITRLLLIMSCCLPLLSQALGSPQAEGAKKSVFAHYMLCFTPPGKEDLVELYKKEIQAAQARGIDGFALNAGGWSLAEPMYRERALKMYEAAKQLGSSFKLMISADFCCGLTDEEVVDMVETFRAHPAQFSVDGKPVLSTFAGDSRTAEFVKKEFKGERSIVFVPYFYPEPASELPENHEVEQVFSANPSLDGFFYFGAAGEPAQLADVNRRLAKRWKGAGKIFMASVTPYYRGLMGNYRVFESHGFENLAENWRAAIEEGADWVEIVTWNDLNESSYVSPFVPENLPSHVGFLDFCSYYAAWFKNGRPPEITKDQIFYAYRLHPKSQQGLSDPADPNSSAFPRRHDTLEDHVHVCTLLTAPATLEVRVGDAISRFDLPAGPASVKAPFGPGTPEFKLVRHDATVLSHRSEQAISDDASSNFNYFAGSVSTP